MPRPALVKLGGSLLTDKARPEAFRRGAATRLAQELARARMPIVLLHGAGSFGHPIVMRTGLGTGTLDATRRKAVPEVFASLAVLEARVLAAAEAAGLQPVPVGVEATARFDSSGTLSGLPVREIQELVDDGWTPVLHGTLARSPKTGWKVASADRLLADLSHEMQPRLCLFATDVDGVMEGTRLLPKVRPSEAPADLGGTGDDATGRMAGKLEMAFVAAQSAPTMIVNGTVRGRVLEALRGGPVVGTRVEA